MTTSPASTRVLAALVLIVVASATTLPAAADDVPGGDVCRPAGGFGPDSFSRIIGEIQGIGCLLWVAPIEPSTTGSLELDLPRIPRLSATMDVYLAGSSLLPFEGLSLLAIDAHSEALGTSTLAKISVRKVLGLGSPDHFRFTVACARTEGQVSHSAPILVTGDQHSVTLRVDRSPGTQLATLDVGTHNGHAPYSTVACVFEESEATEDAKTTSVRFGVLGSTVGGSAGQLLFAPRSATIGWGIVGQGPTEE